MQGYTVDKSMAIYCAEKLRAKEIFAEVMSTNDGHFNAEHEVWIKKAGGQLQADLDAAFAGRFVEFKED